MSTIAKTVYDRCGGYGKSVQLTNKEQESVIKNWGSGKESNITFQDGSVLTLSSGQHKWIIRESSHEQI